MIAVEDPSDDFEMLRDFVDARDCMKLKTYAPANLKKGYSNEMAEEASKTLKMTKVHLKNLMKFSSNFCHFLNGVFIFKQRQARRMYEVLRLRTVNTNNDKEFKEYRLDVKRRLNIPYQVRRILSLSHAFGRVELIELFCEFT